MPALMRDLLQRTSRTFALTIPLLAEPLQGQVRIAYLLFRISDTCEDGELLGRAERLGLLDRFLGLLVGSSAQSASAFARECAARPPTAKADDARLLSHTPEVLAALEGCGAVAAEIITRRVADTTSRMRGFVERSDDAGALTLGSFAELEAYCYAVAGIVGEMLTELVLLDQPELTPAQPLLWREAAAFGEGLQLTNILKDSAEDLTQGRRFLPPGVEREMVFERAAEDLRRARTYVGCLHAHGARSGTLAFHALPVRLAEATLARVRAHGPGAKISRVEVAQNLLAMQLALAAGGSGL